MKKDELILLKGLMETEYERRKRANKFLEMQKFKEYAPHIDINELKLETDAVSILEKVLKYDLKITKTYGIYVCTSSTEIGCSIRYQETDYYVKELAINSKYAENKVYHDIESKKTIRATKEPNDYDIPLIEDFERNNIVLNPYNECKNMNGYYEVRNEFFLNAIKYGQVKSKHMILKKYPRL